MATSSGQPSLIPDHPDEKNFEQDLSEKRNKPLKRGWGKIFSVFIEAADSVTGPGVGMYFICLRTSEIWLLNVR